MAIIKLDNIKGINADVETFQTNFVDDLVGFDPNIVAGTLKRNRISIDSRIFYYGKKMINAFYYDSYDFGECFIGVLEDFSFVFLVKDTGQIFNYDNPYKGSIAYNDDELFDDSLMSGVQIDRRFVLYDYKNSIIYIITINKVGNSPEFKVEYDDYKESTNITNSLLNKFDVKVDIDNTQGFTIPNYMHTVNDDLSDYPLFCRIVILATVKGSNNFKVLFDKKFSAQKISFKSLDNDDVKYIYYGFTGFTISSKRSTGGIDIFTENQEIEFYIFEGYSNNYDLIDVTLNSKVTYNVKTGKANYEFQAINYIDEIKSNYIRIREKVEFISFYPETFIQDSSTTGYNPALMYNMNSGFATIKSIEVGGITYQVNGHQVRYQNDYKYYDVILSVNNVPTGFEKRLLNMKFDIELSNVYSPWTFWQDKFLVRYAFAPVTRLNPIGTPLNDYISDENIEEEMIIKHSVLHKGRIVGVSPKNHKNNYDGFLVYSSRNAIGGVAPKKFILESLEQIPVEYQDIYNIYSKFNRLYIFSANGILIYDVDKYFTLIEDINLKINSKNHITESNNGFYVVSDNKIYKLDYNNNLSVVSGINEIIANSDTVSILYNKKFSILIARVVKNRKYQKNYYYYELYNSWLRENIYTADFVKTINTRTDTYGVLKFSNIISLINLIYDSKGKVDTAFYLKKNGIYLEQNVKFYVDRVKIFFADPNLDRIGIWNLGIVLNVSVIIDNNIYSLNFNRFEKGKNYVEFVMPLERRVLTNYFDLVINGYSGIDFDVEVKSIVIETKDFGDD
jgi:hypothetical protein